MNIYEITKEFQLIENELIENDGELTPELMEKLDLTEKNLKLKSQNYVAVIKNFESQNDIIDNEIKRLQGLKKARKKAIDNLKKNLSTAMFIFDLEKIELPLNKISFRKSTSVDITCDVDSLPSSCKKIKIEANKSEIKKLLQSGEKIEGCELVHKQNIQIK